MLLPIHYVESVEELPLRDMQEDTPSTAWEALLIRQRLETSEGDWNNSYMLPRVVIEMAIIGRQGFLEFYREKFFRETSEE